MNIRRGLVGGIVLSLTCSVNDARAAAASDLPRVGPVRALVVSPHPDDAALAAGGLIQRIIGDGGRFGSFK